jgi:hypothetical protein
MVALRVLRCDEKGTKCPGAQMGYFVSVGCKYGDMALQVREVTNKIIKYGLNSAGLGAKSALASPRSNCTSKLETHLPVREGISQQYFPNVKQKRKNLVMGY